MTDAEHLARNGPVWFTTCAVNEGRFDVYGPFFSYEDAKAECWPFGRGVPCPIQEAHGGAHLIGRTVGATVNVSRGHSRTGMPCHHAASKAWHDLPTNQRAGVIDLASLLRISAA